MKSTNNDKRTFSMDDFEKGLMLSGFVSPCSINELNERLELESYEKKLRNENKDIFFRRVVLAAEVAYQLHEEPTFGRIKFQKLVYLCEHVAQMNLQNRYTKQVAGPFDNKFMHSIENEFETNKWFEVEKVKYGTMNRSKYKPLLLVENYKRYFQTYFAQHEKAIQQIIDLFRTETTDTTEVAATLYACQWELKDTPAGMSESDLLQKFYEWSEKKKRFKPDRVLSIWQWMTKKGLLSI